jgi:integrase
MVTKRFTVRWLEAVKPPATDRVEYWDGTISGFGLRVTDRGRMTWVLLYRHEGRKRRYTLGTYPALSLADAREAADEALVAVAKGRDPATEKKAARVAETFGELFDQYLENYAKPRKKSWKEDERAFKRDLLPRFRHRKAVSITRKELRDLLRDIVNRGAPVLANRTMEMVRRMYHWALEEEILEVNPFTAMKPPGEERRRDRVLSDEEIKQVWQALDGEPARIAARFRLQLLTGQRPGEVRQMRWSDVDAESGWWIIPNELTKNGRAHRVPLTHSAIAILEELHRNGHDNSPWVFPSPARSGPVRSNTKPTASIRKSSTVDFRPHDLRRTVATNITGLGFSRFLIGRLLNHVDQSVTGVYDLYQYDREKQQMLVTWERQLDLILLGRKDEDGKVVSLRTA